MDDDKDRRFGFRYLDVRRMIMDMTGKNPRELDATFNKIRLNPIMSDLRVGTSNRALYDLRKTIGIVATHQLSCLHIGVGRALTYVTSTMPQVVESALVAAAEAGLIEERPGMLGIGPVLRLRIGAPSDFADKIRGDNRRGIMDHGDHVQVDLRRTVQLITRRADLVSYHDALVAAFLRLSDVTFDGTVDTAGETNQP